MGLGSGSGSSAASAFGKYEAVDVIEFEEGVSEYAHVEKKEVMESAMCSLRCRLSTLSCVAR